MLRRGDEGWFKWKGFGWLVFESGYIKIPGSSRGFGWLVFESG